MEKVSLDQRFSEDVQSAIQLLQSVGCSEIYLFGSLARGTAEEDSDIDIAVRGIPAEKFFNVYGQLLMNLAHDIDLVDLDLQEEFGRELLSSTEMVRVA